MKNHFTQNHRQFLALLTILSFTFTQAVPAWALRPQQGADNPATRTGLEEALSKPAAIAQSTVPLEPATRTVSIRGVDSPLLSVVFGRLEALPVERRNTREMVLEALGAFRAGVPPRVSAQIPPQQEISSQLDDLISHSPALDCPTCGAQLAHAILSNPFSDPEYRFPEALQSPQFQEEEVLNAVLLAMSILQNGRLLTLQGPDGHRMPASTAADVRDLLLLAEAVPGFPQALRHQWVGARLSQGDMEQALKEGQLVVAHMGGNHFVQVTQISDGRVEYTDPQRSSETKLPTPAVASLSTQAFFDWWKSDARANTGIALIGHYSGQALHVRNELSDSELAGVVGCCGINATFAHFRSVRKILDAVLRLKYRAPDDTGILAIGRNGLLVRKVQGAPDALILEMISAAPAAGPLFPETLNLPADPNQNRIVVAQYRKDRRALLLDEGLTSFVPPEWQDPGQMLHDMWNSSIDGLYAGAFGVSIGDVGGLFSGWVYTLGSSADQYQTLNGPLLNLGDMISRWDLTPEFVKLFLRHRLMQELLQNPEDLVRIAVLADFDRLGDRAMKQVLDRDEQAAWDQIWKKYLQGRTITVSPDFNRDPVRHVFRLLDQLVGSFRVHPEWAKEVQDRFDRRRPAGKREWDWRTYWELEYRYNMPGHAYGALVDWVQDWTFRNGLVPEGIHQRWAARRQDQEQRRKFSDGVVDLPLLLVLPEIVLGHGRWAMTGDPKWWNGHPQVTTSRAIVHNGAIEADKNNELKQEHENIYKALMQAAASLRRDRSFDRAVMEQAEAMEQAVRRNYGRFEDVAETQEIVTDTRTIVRQWQAVADDYREDLAQGRVQNGLIDLSQPGHLNRVGQTYEGRPVFDRAKAWNQVVSNLREHRKVENPNLDEVASRVAMMELAPGSGIATDGVSLETPFTEFVTSHDRPVDIVVRQHKGSNGQVAYEDYMVTSDSAAGIGLFPAGEVDQAARQIAALEDRAMREIDRAREDLAAHRTTDDQFSTRVMREVVGMQEGVDRIVKGEKYTETVDGKPVERRRGGFDVLVYHLKGAEKYARITRKLDAEGRQVVDVQITKFNGEPLDAKDPSLRLVAETVNPSLGDRGRFQSFMDKHIAEIPLILLKQVLNYLQMSAGQADAVVKLDTVFPAGVQPVIEQDEQGLHTRIPRETPIQRPGLNSDVIRKHFGGLEEGNQLPNLKRVVLVGVGSSWRDAKIAQALFQELLPGVEMIVYDPVEVQNQGKLQELNPKTDLVVGMSWSGTTDSMVRLFNPLEEAGFVTIAITGKPDSDMGRIGRWSGGTINVLSGDESTVATTKGFESVLYSLSLLAVQLSQLQGNPALGGARSDYVKGLRQVADLAYDVLAEREKPKGSRVLDLNDDQSLVNRLGREYAQREKLLWIGNRNYPIHVEGELKGEEIASIVGVAADIDDSSWQATVTHNLDPKAEEKDKVIFGFDMTDPDRFDEFMAEIRKLAEAGADFIILTFDARGNPHFEELEFLAGEHAGKIHLVTVPQVRTTLQPLINALFYFRFGTALAKGRGMTAAEIENSRNLAKSVTVSYAQNLKDLLLSTKTKVLTVDQQASPASKAKQNEAMARHLQLMSGKAWQAITDSRLRAIQRLPAVLRQAYGSFFSDSSWLASEQARQRLEQAFGPKAEKIRQVVIVTDEEATEYAAQASEAPFSSVEVAYSGTGDGSVYDPANQRVAIPLRGVYYRVSFDRKTQSYQLKFDPSLEQNKGLSAPATQGFSIPQGTSEVDVNGRRYSVDATSFMRDKKKSDNLLFGLTLRAVNPDLLGVPVKVFRAVDRALDREIGRPDTLFLLVSRSNNLHEQNYRIAPVSSKTVEGGRTSSDLEQLASLKRRPETAMLNRAEQLRQSGSHFLSLSDPGSALFRPGSEWGLGNVALPGDLDDTSLYSATYLALLSVGTKLGAFRGIDTTQYREALGTVPGLVAGVLRNQELRRRADRFVNRFGDYKKIHVIGGGQAYADAKEYARVFRGLGIFAEAQLNDSAWHGPLAAVDPSREKFSDKDRRVGVNPSFDPVNDTLIFILMTDRRFFNTALGGDAQVYDSRNARFGLVIKTSDQGLNAVQKVGAAEDGIFPLADFPDEFGNFANAAAAQYIAASYAKRHAQVLGRPILPPPATAAVQEAAPSGIPAALRAEVEQSLSGIFRPFAGPIAYMLMAFESSGAPQFVSLQDPTDANSSFLFLIAVDRPGLFADVTQVIATSRVSGQRINIEHSLSPKTAGLGGVMYLHLNRPASDIEQLRDPLLGVMAVPPVVLFPGVSEPTPGERLDATGLRLSQAASSLVVRAAQSGLVGSALREGITGRYTELAPDQRERLENLSRYAAQVWAPLQTREVGTQSALVLGEVTGRSGAVSLSGEPGTFALWNALENIKAALTDRYNSAPEESGAFSYVVWGPGLYDIGDPRKIPQNLYAQIVAFYVPPDRRASFAGVDPLVPIPQVQNFLRSIADANGRPLSQVRVVTLPRVPRSKLYIDRFTELSRQGAIRFTVPQDGTVEWSLRATLPVTGSTEEVVVVMATALLPQAIATLGLSAGMPEGAFVSVHLLPDGRTLDSRAAQATPAVPIGGAKDFTPAHLESVTQWLGNAARAQAFLAGKPITTLDIRRPVSGVLVPHTSMISLPVQVNGMAYLGEERNRVRVQPIRVQDRKVWVQPMEFRLGDLPQEAQFTPDGPMEEPDPVEISLRAQLGPKLPAPEVDDIVAAYRVYSHLQAPAPGAPVPVHTEVTDVPGQPGQSRAVIIAPYSVDAGQRIAQVLQQKGLSSGGMFIDSFQETNASPLRALGIVNIANASPEQTTQSDLSDAFQQVLQPPPVSPVHQSAAERGWVLDADRNLYRTLEGGWVSSESVLGVDPAARIGEGSLILGEATRVGAGAEITRSLVENAVIGEKAEIVHAVIRTDESARDSWSWNKTYKVDPVPQTVIGQGVVVHPTLEGEPAEIVNAVVGQRAKIAGGFLKNSVIGADNILIRAKVVLTHTEDNVTLATENGAPLEVSESWLGWGNRLDEEGYYEHLAPNFVRRAWVDAAGQVQFETVLDVPAVVPQGFRTVDASYDGTGKVGKEFSSSRHGKGVKFPGAMVGPLTNIILHVHPDFESPEDLLRAESVDSKNSVYAQLTALHPFSFSHRVDSRLTPGKAERPHGEVWGQVIPGGSRYGLNTDDRSSLWVFEHARPAIEQILTEMHDQADRHARTVGLDPDQTAAIHEQIDRLPRYALETGKAMARLSADSVLEHQYDQHLNNGGPKVERRFADDRYEVKLTTPGPEYQRFAMQDLMLTDHPARGDWAGLPLFKPEDNAAMERLPAGIQVSPDSKIGKNVTIRGARASLKGVTIPDGATVFLYDASLENTVLADGAEIRKTVLRGGWVGEKARLTGVRAEDSTFGPGDTASNAVIVASHAAANVAFEAYARVTDSSIGRDGIIGSPVWNSQFGAGVTDHHLAARVRYVRTPDYGSVPNLTNISAGVDARGTAENPIVLESTMTGANMPIGAGAKTGFLSFVKGALQSGQVVPPYAFSRGPDAKQLQKGYVPEKMQSMAMRFIGKTAKITPPQDRPAIAELVQQKIAEAGLNRLAQSWQLQFTVGSEVPVFVGGKWQFKPRYTSGPEDQGFGPNPTYVWIQQSTGLEESVAPLPELNTAVVPSPVQIIAGPHVSALAIGSAVSRVTTRDGRAAAQVVFVVENEAQAKLVKQKGVPMVVFSASDPQYGSVEAALIAARQFLEGAVELGTDGQPVPEPIQKLLFNLFGIELSPESIGVWNAFIRDASLAFQA